MSIVGAITLLVGLHLVELKLRIMVKHLTMVLLGYEVVESPTMVLLA